MPCLAIARRAAGVLFAVVLAGCAGVNVKETVPPLTKPPQPLVDRTLSVAAVKGADVSGYQMLNGEVLRDSLVAALKASGRFRAVGTGAGEVELRTTVLTFEATKDRVPFFSMEVRRALTATYDVVEVASGRSLLRETIRAEAGSAAFGGADALRESTTLAIKENMRLLIEAIDEKRPGGR